MGLFRVEYMCLHRAMMGQGVQQHVRAYSANPNRVWCIQAAGHMLSSSLCLSSAAVAVEWATG